MPRLVLIHGAATTYRVWAPLLPYLADFDVDALERPRTGDLHRELAWLRPRVEGAFVVGMSGGATLGLGLTASGVPLAGAVLHEPAVGSLLPELLAPIATAFADRGTVGLAQALYGSSWTPEMFDGVGSSGRGGAEAEEITQRELAMFRGFEPGPPSANAGQVLVTYGQNSPDVRRLAADRLHETCGYQIGEITGAHHFVAHDHPAAFAHVINKTVN